MEDPAPLCGILRKHFEMDSDILTRGQIVPGSNCPGSNCPWGQIVPGSNCPGVKLSLGSNCPWGQIVLGVKLSSGSNWVGAIGALYSSSARSSQGTTKKASMKNRMTKPIRGSVDRPKLY